MSDLEPGSLNCSLFYSGKDELVSLGFKISSGELHSSGILDLGFGLSFEDHQNAALYWHP